jgi:hypothetical protein
MELTLHPLSAIMVASILALVITLVIEVIDGELL